MSSEIISLGVSAYYHDSAVSIVQNDGAQGKILAAASEERFSRIKADKSFPVRSAESILKFIELNWDQIDSFAFYEDPFKKFQRILMTQVHEFPRGYKQTKHVINDFKLSQLLLWDYKKLIDKRKIDVYNHHLSHAASSFFASNFDESAVLTLDGVGEFETGTIYHGSNNHLKKLRHTKFPNSLGLFYAAITSYLGFRVNSGEYKVMGLAPYGKSTFVKEIESELIRIYPDGSLKLNMKYFDFTRGLSMFNDKIDLIFKGPPRNSEEFITQRYCDVAKSLQVLTEKIVFLSARYALKISGSRNLCYAGGVALNCVANSRITELIDAGNIFIQPAAGDAGGSLGAAFLSNVSNLKNRSKTIRFNMNQAFLGLSYEEVEKNLIEWGFKFEKFDNLKQLDYQLAKYLSLDQVIGWFRGRSEFGPRSLGARSILGNPLNPSMQKKMNLKIKKRESFRPFAPIVLLEEAARWFEWDSKVESEFMLFVSNVNPKKLLKQDPENDSQALLTDRLGIVRSQIPAVTHVDNSARLQTINKVHPFRNVLEEFHKITGVPVLINTSFNVRNEPIVESPIDALKCFMTTDIDMLAIEKFLIKKIDQHESLIEQWRKFVYSGEND